MSTSSSFDMYFMNHSYASEIWLRDYMEGIKTTQPEWWNGILESQLSDERRHVEMCRAAILKEGGWLSEDPEVSIQFALYGKVGGIEFDQTSHLESFHANVYLIERRARFLYKMYGRYGNNPLFKRVIAAILSDEQRHVANHDKVESVELKKLLEVDCYVFNDYLPAKYAPETGARGQHVFTSMNYWRDLFGHRVHQN